MSDQPLIAVIDPGMGNLRSVCKAWEHVGAEVRLVSKVAQLGKPDALVFPGQGGMPHCMDALCYTGFDKLIKKWIAADKPFFGICLGLQALFESSEEGAVKGLSIFPGHVRRFQLDPHYKIPHMGWNSLTFKDDTNPIQKGLKQAGEQFYFVHSYFVETSSEELVWCETEYQRPFVSGICRGNCYASQFHPEKSQSNGLQIYRNFMTLIGN